MSDHSKALDLARSVVEIDDSDSPGEFTGPRAAVHSALTAVSRALLALDAEARELRGVVEAAKQWREIDECCAYVFHSPDCCLQEREAVLRAALDTLAKGGRDA